MQIRTVEQNGIPVAVAAAESGERLLYDVQSALDLIATVQYETGANRIALPKSAVAEEFFKLGTGLAGEVLQKFINYGVKLALIGDYAQYTSKPLRDFIRESNRGRDIFFVPDEETAVARLSAAG